MSSATLTPGIKTLIASSGKNIRTALLGLKKDKVENIYDDGLIYDLAYQGSLGDTAFYEKKASKGRVLYVGVGTGRIFSSLYKINPNIIGIDNSKKMLNRLLGQNPEINPNSLICDDIRTINFEEGSFDVIIAPFSFFTHFNRNESVSILRRMKKWLSHSGYICTDFFPPNVPERKMEITVSVKNGIQIETLIIYDTSNQTLIEYTKVINEDSLKLHRLELNYYEPKQIKQLFIDGGFKSNVLYGSFKEESLTDKSDVYVIEARLL